MTWQIFTTSFRLSLGIKVTLEGVWTGLAFTSKNVPFISLARPRQKQQTYCVYVARAFCLATPCASSAGIVVPSLR